MRPRIWHWCVAVLLLVSGVNPGHAQYNIGYEPWTDLPFIEDGQVLRNAYAGGFNAPQFSAIDLNLDGIEDLVVFDRDGNRIRPFINGGTPGQIDYDYAPEYISHFPPMEHFALFHDYDCDGLADIFTANRGAIAVYRNTTTPGSSLRFELAKSTLTAINPENGKQIEIVVSTADLPAISDVNGDGAPDILTFSTDGSFVSYFENVSLEQNDCSLLAFRWQDPCWGGFSEQATSNAINLDAACKGATIAETSVHSGSTLLALDINNDNLQDLILGDLGATELVLLTNGGDANTAHMVDWTTEFTGLPYPDIEFFPAAFYLDVNNDGSRDLLVAPNSKGISDNLRNVWYYRNDAAPDAAPNFTFASTEFLADEMIEHGAGPRPLVTDVNGDGLPDILVMGYGRYTGFENFEQTTTYYRNTGTATEPEFTLATREFGFWTINECCGFAMTAGDLDDDGAIDLVLGDLSGEVSYWRNLAPGGDSCNWNPLPFPSAPGTIDVGQVSAPQLADVDRDGLLDLLIGERSGTIAWHRNTGTKTTPDFSDQPEAAPFGNIDVRPACCTGYAAPVLAEFESGKYHLMVGTESGKMYFYDEVETDLYGSFTLVDSIVTNGNRITPTVYDLDQDGTLEIIYGEETGGITVLKKMTDAPISTPENQKLPTVFALYPNPSAGIATIDLAAVEPTVQISVLSITGQQLWSKAFYGKQQLSIAPDNLPAGLYLVRIETTNRVEIKRWIVE